MAWKTALRCWHSWGKQIWKFMRLTHPQCQNMDKERVRKKDFLLYFNSVVELLTSLSVFWRWGCARRVNVHIRLVFVSLKTSSAAVQHQVSSSFQIFGSRALLRPSLWFSISFSILLFLSQISPISSLRSARLAHLTITWLVL